MEISHDTVLTSMVRTLAASDASYTEIDSPPSMQILMSVNLAVPVAVMPTVLIPMVLTPVLVTVDSLAMG